MREIEIDTKAEKTDCLAATKGMCLTPKEEPDPREKNKKDIAGNTSKNQCKEVNA
mgnify:CR=1 FL=1